jgi:transposase
MAVDAHGNPIRFIVTQGSTADCTQARGLLEGFCADNLLADRGYDNDDTLACAEEMGAQAIIPPKKNRKIQREYDKEIYKLRHLVENTFLQIKQWRGIATRYAKNLSSFVAAVQIRCLVMWGKII